VPRLSHTAAGLCLLAGLGLPGCLDAYPEVSLTNRTRVDMLLRNLSFQGCLWEGPLAYGESTRPLRCLPGSDRLRLEKHDPLDEDFHADGRPMWFPYQTVRPRRAGWGESHRFEIRFEELEQDFSAPSPYGH
jgi:hypothetical protein